MDQAYQLTNEERVRIDEIQDLQTRVTTIKIISAIAFAGALAACTVGQPTNPTMGGVEGGSSGAVIGCLITIPIGCAPGAVIGGVAGGTLGATGNAVAVPPPPQPPQAAAAS